MLKFVPVFSKARLAKSIKVPINSGALVQFPGVCKKTASAKLTLSIVGGWILSNIFTPVYAATTFDNSGVQFDQDTTLETRFIESHGAYQSTFGVIDLTTNQKTPLLIETKPSDHSETIFKPSSRRSHVGTPQDFLGTPGNAVPNPIARYTFKAKTSYVFYLESTYNGRPTGVLYSNNVLNPNREKQVVFNGSADALCTAGIVLAWDDTGSRIVRTRADQDRDFDDFLVRVRQTACAIGGGEPSPVVSPASQTPPIGALPAAVAPANLGWLSLLGLVPFAFIDGGGSRSTSSGGGFVPPAPLPPPGSPPPSPIPEPFSVFGSIGALGVGALLERRRRELAQRGLKVAARTVRE